MVCDWLGRCRRMRRCVGCPARPSGCKEQDVHVELRNDEEFQLTVQQISDFIQVDFKVGNLPRRRVEPVREEPTRLIISSRPATLITSKQDS